MSSSNILPNIRDVEVVQKITPYNKQGLQETGDYNLCGLQESKRGIIFVLRGNNMGSNIHIRNHDWYDTPKKYFIPVVDNTPQFFLGYYIKKVKKEKIWCQHHILS